MMLEPVLDLGEVEGPVLIFGGPYGNLQATQALLQVAEDKNIPESNIICTGDLTAYCADPEETSNLIRLSGMPAVMGNCEESLGQDAQDCGCGFEKGSVCAEASLRWFAYNAGQVSDDNKRWMGALPRRIDFRFAGKKVSVVHGSASSINQFIFESTEAAEKQKSFESTNADIIIGGHSGLPFTQKIDDKIWHNAGVIGMPANDGTPRVWYSVLDEGGFTHYALNYDYEGAANALDKAGHCPQYAATLRSGLWDNCDILPPYERALRGKELPGRFGISDDKLSA